MRPESRTVRIALVIAFALSVGLIATLLPAWWAAAAFAAIVAAFAFVATRQFAGGDWINITQPTLASSLALFGGVGYQYFFEGREKRKMKRLFGQYVSKDVYEQLVANPDLARLGGQRRADDGALLRHPRVHDRVGKRAARRDRRHPQRVLHPHGRDRLRAQGDARQVRRRHGDGAVRGAARRSRITPSTRSTPRSR